MAREALGTFRKTSESFQKGSKVFPEFQRSYREYLEASEAFRSYVEGFGQNGFLRCFWGLQRLPRDLQSSFLKGFKTFQGVSGAFMGLREEFHYEKSSKVLPGVSKKFPGVIRGFIGFQECSRRFQRDFVVFVYWQDFLGAYEVFRGFQPISWLVFRRVSRRFKAFQVVLKGFRGFRGIIIKNGISRDFRKSLETLQKVFNVFQDISGEFPGGSWAFRSFRTTSERLQRSASRLREILEGVRRV